MQLQTALSQIGEIQRQMARTRIFRGYRAGTTLATGAAAVLAAVWQGRLIPHAGADALGFVELWVAVAVACVVLVGAEIFLRYRKSDSSLERELTVLATEQFLPCILVGGVITGVICWCAPKEIWMLPALWPIFFGLGLLASRRLLPRAIGLVGAFYIIGGLCGLAFGAGSLEFSAWQMGLTFGIGQSGAAAVLHVALERRHGS